jgi:hypothetical protein
VKKITLFLIGCLLIGSLIFGFLCQAWAELKIVHQGSHITIDRKGNIITGYNIFAVGKLIKYNRKGEKLWEVEVPEVSPEMIFVDQKNNIYLLGGIVTKCDENGNILWIRRPEREEFFCSSGGVTLNGEALLVGPWGSDPTNTWCWKYDSKGRELWRKKLPDYFNFSLLDQKSGEFLVIHSLRREIIEYDPSGRILSKNKYQGGPDIFLNWEVLSADGIVGGKAIRHHFVYSFYVVKGNRKGEILWEKEVKWDPGVIAVDSFGNILVAADETDYIQITKFSPEGEVLEEISSEAGWDVQDIDVFQKSIFVTAKSHLYRDQYVTIELK